MCNPQITATARLRQVAADESADRVNSLQKDNLTWKGVLMPSTKDWPHAPIHRINSDGIYMVTGATLHKEHVFNTG